MASMDELLSGGPKWLSNQKFDIELKVGNDEVTAFQASNLNQRREMLRTLLFERTRLSIHHESVQLRVYQLIVAKQGPKFHESSSHRFSRTDLNDGGLVVNQDSGRLEVQEFSMPALVLSLRFTLGWTVIDKTGLTGRYDFSLRWTPDQGLNSA